MALKGHAMHHMTPFCWLPSWRWADGQFLERCKHGVLSYTVVKIICTFSTVVLEYYGLFREGDFDFRYGYVYIAIITNCSQLWAMYCLILWYHANMEELAPFHPLAKLICVKAVVFFSFWQGIVIAGLVYVKVIQASAQWTSYNLDSVSRGLQDFLVCVEMFFAALGHWKAFSHREYRDKNLPPQTLMEMISAMCDVSDVQHDIASHVAAVTSTLVSAVKTSKPATAEAQNAADEALATSLNQSNIVMATMQGSSAGVHARAPLVEHKKGEGTSSAPSTPTADQSAPAAAPAQPEHYDKPLPVPTHGQA